ncbi:MAG: hypothetical protein WCR47_04305 [Desulfoplanes sp.]
MPDNKYSEDEAEKCPGKKIGKGLNDRGGYSGKKSEEHDIFL